MSDAGFLFFLYSEKDREESLNSYQGWNIWAIISAMKTEGLKRNGNHYLSLYKY
jgi:hypothetical protein